MSSSGRFPAHQRKNLGRTTEEPSGRASHRCVYVLRRFFSFCRLMVEKNLCWSTNHCDVSRLHYHCFGVVILESSLDRHPVISQRSFLFLSSKQIFHLLLRIALKSRRYSHKIQRHEDEPRVSTLPNRKKPAPRRGHLQAGFGSSDAYSMRLENVGGARPVLYLQARQYLAGILPTKNWCQTLLSALSDLLIPRIPYTGFCGLRNRIDKELQLSFL